jgi:hypothetical protein
MPDASSYASDAAPGGGGGSSEDKIGRLTRRFQAAKAEHNNWERLWQDCYDFALPHRKGFTRTDTSGKSLTDRSYDMTAAVSLQEFASRLQAGMTPTFARWSKLMPGELVDTKQRAQAEANLEEVTEALYRVIHRSNFDSQIHESYLDLGVGTGSIICDEDVHDVVRFSAVPLTEVYLDAGPFDSLDGRFRYREMTVRDYKLTWPRATLPDALRADDDVTLEKKIHVVEQTVRNWDERNEEVYDYTVFIEQQRHIGFESEYRGLGSCPWINFRWSKAAGEVYGRGPLLLALPDVKVANLIVEMTLDYAEMTLAGLWQADDDGVLNPATITLTPGTIIPIAQNSRGLQPLEPPGKFDLSQLMLENLRGNIKRALYDEMLGPPTGTPMSATEVSERSADLYRRIGSAYGRLQQELVQPIVRRVLYVMRKRGMIKLPLGKAVVEVHSVSPLASAQAQEDVLKFQQFIQMVSGTFGPQMMTMLVKPGPTVDWLAGQQGVRKDLLYSQEEQVQMMQQMQSMAQGMAGNPGGGGAPDGAQQGGAPPQGAPPQGAPA